MLTMCRTLMGDPDLVMIDEPIPKACHHRWFKKVWTAGVARESAVSRIQSTCWRKAVHSEMDIADRVLRHGHGPGRVTKARPASCRQRERRTQKNGLRSDHVRQKHLTYTSFLLKSSRAAASSSLRRGRAWEGKFFLAFDTK